jgi:hypothetical protein
MFATNKWEDQMASLINRFMVLFVVLALAIAAAAPWSWGR